MSSRSHIYTATLPVMFFSFIILYGGFSFNSGHEPVNHSPVVRITAPADNSDCPLNVRVPYSINVSDPEDGESKYNEINAKEVYLEIRYVPANSTKELSIKNDKVYPGFALICSSNCANCHEFNARLIGPSYSGISRRYSENNANIELLSQRIMNGTSGVWGAVKMPSHPELNSEQARNIVRWILENGKNPNLDYYTGTEGSFMLTQPAGQEKDGFFTLTAIYYDHGSADNPLQKLGGRDVIRIRIK